MSKRYEASFITTGPKKMYMSIQKLISKNHLETHLSHLNAFPAIYHF